MSDEAVLAVIRVLKDKGIPYMVVGSLAGNLYGIPRATQDADFVIQLGDTSIRDVVHSLGPGFRLEPQLSFETVTMTQKFLVHAPTGPFQIELFLLTDDPFDQSRFKRRMVMPLFGDTAVDATAEDMIVQKLRWARRKDLDDLVNIISMQNDRLDWPYIEKWCRDHGTTDLLAQLREEAR
jgi:hypothetical protein